MSRKAGYITRQTFDSSTLTGSYQAFGDPLSAPCVYIKVVNNSTVDVDISTNGTEDHDIVPAGSYTVIDIRTNKGIDDDFSFQKGTQFYINGSAGTGNIYLVGIKEIT